MADLAQAALAICLLVWWARRPSGTLRRLREHRERMLNFVRGSTDMDLPGNEDESATQV